MMILRTKEPQYCTEWIHLNRMYGTQNGFPERALQVAASGGGTSAVARAVEANIALAGRVKSGGYRAHLMNSTRALFNLEQSYEILFVRDTHSTAWIP